MAKETSPRISTMASRYMRISAEELRARAEKDGEELAAEIRSMAASLLSQDMTPGQG